MQSLCTKETQRNSHQHLFLSQNVTQTILTTAKVTLSSHSLTHAMALVHLTCYRSEQLFCISVVENPLKGYPLQSISKSKEFLILFLLHVFLDNLGNLGLFEGTLFLLFISLKISQVPQRKLDEHYNN